MKNFGLYAFTLLLAACAAATAGPYGRFYHDNTAGVDVTRLPNIELSTDKPQIEQGKNSGEDQIRMLEDGYVMVGYSSFTAGRIDPESARIQAGNVHASRVLLYSAYKTRSAGPSPSPQDRLEYFATYWVKLKTTVLGVHLQNLTPEMKQKLGANTGVLVLAVVKGSPAAEADVKRGDVITKIGDAEVSEAKILQDAVAKSAGQKVTIELLRQGNGLKKEIQLNPGK